MKKIKLLSGDKLRQLREKAGLLQSDLADLTGFSQSTISQAEKDVNTFKIDNVKSRIMEYFMLKDINVYCDFLESNGFSKESVSVLRDLLQGNINLVEGLIKLSEVYSEQGNFTKNTR